MTLANATSTINVLGSVTATTFYGVHAGANTGAFSNIYSANALTTTNLFANTMTLANASASITGNLYVSNTVTTTNLVANTLTLANSTSTINVIGTVAASTLYGAHAGANTGAFSTLTLTSALGVSYGGTGLASYTSGGLVYASGTTTLASSGAYTSGQILYGGGAGAAPISSTGFTYNTTSGLMVDPYMGTKQYAGSYIGMNTYWNGSAWAQYTASSPGLVIRGSTSVQAAGTTQFLVNNATSLIQTEVMTFRHPSTGTAAYVGIMTASPSGTYTLEVTGTIGSTADITAFTSDERLKFKTGPITDALDKVCTLDTFTYTHNDLARSFGFTDNRQYVGISAQQVLKVQPEVVRMAPFDADGEKSKSGQDYMTVQYERLVPLLIEAIKEERKAREALEVRVKLLEQK